MSDVDMLVLYRLLASYMMTEQEYELSKCRAETYSLYEEVIENVRRASDAIRTVQNYLRA